KFLIHRVVDDWLSSAGDINRIGIGTNDSWFEYTSIGCNARTTRLRVDIFNDISVAAMKRPIRTGVCVIAIDSDFECCSVEGKHPNLFGVFLGEVAATKRPVLAHKLLSEYQIEDIVHDKQFPAGDRPAVVLADTNEGFHGTGRCSLYNGLNDISYFESDQGIECHHVFFI